MRSEKIQLRVGGQVFQGWKEVEFKSSLQALCSSFVLKIADEPEASDFPIREGSLCELYAGADLRMVGYVDAVESTLDHGEHRLTIEGRDLAQDLVDCVPIDLPAEYYDITLLELATELARPFGLSVAIQSGPDPGPPFDVFALQPCETAHDALERACRLRGFLKVCDPTGLVVLTRAGAARAEVVILEGDNVLSSNWRRDVSGRFRRVAVRGIQMGSDTVFGDACTSIAEALDPAIRATRTLAVQAEDSIDEAEAQLRADWDVAVRAGRGRALTVRTPGWRQNRDSGPLWIPNLIVPVEIPSQRISGEFLIEAVRAVSSDDEGDVTDLGLAPLGSFLPEPPRSDQDGGFGEDVEEGG